MGNDLMILLLITIVVAIAVATVNSRTLNDREETLRQWERIFGDVFDVATPGEVIDNTPAKKCSNECSFRMRCFANPCEGMTCPGQNNTECVSTYCNGCHYHFIDTTSNSDEPLDSCPKNC